MPKTNIEFWRDKIAANVTRDKSNQVDLVRLGWQVQVVWECDIKKDVHGVATQLIVLLSLSKAGNAKRQQCSR